MEKRQFIAIHSVIYLEASILRMQLRNVNKQQISEKKTFCERKKASFCDCNKDYLQKASLKGRKFMDAENRNFLKIIDIFALFKFVSNLSQRESLARLKNRPILKLGERHESNCVTEISVVL